MMLEKVKNYIEKEGLLLPGASVLVALSGGADSVALLSVLHRLGYDCRAAHCNFQLRGEESDRDEAFVRALCKQMEVELFVTHFNTTAYADKMKVSIEMAARELRYNWFEQLRIKIGAGSVAVAHHRDDSIETFFINLLRGTGIDGLCGIRPLRDCIVRPLLCVGREEILDYLEHIGQKYVTDSTNLEEEYIRNKVRLSVLPSLERIHPQARQNIAATEKRLSSVAAYYHLALAEEISKVRDGNRIDISCLLSTRKPILLLYEILSPLGFNASQVEDVFYAVQGQSGKEFFSKSYRVVKDRDCLLIQQLGESADMLEKQLFLVEGDNYLPDGRVLILHQVENIDIKNYAIERRKSMACIDADKISQPLVVRHPKKGDKFMPYGMKGKKLVSDFLTDRKYSRIEKEQIWLVCSGEAVVWVVGERPDGRFCLDSATQNLLLIEIR